MERVVRHDNLHRLLARVLECLTCVSQVRRSDGAVLHREGSRGVEAHGHELLISVDGPQIGRDVAPVVAERIEEPAGDIVERHIVIARHYQLRTRQRIQECAGLAELPGSRALCEVAGDGHEVRIQAPDDSEHGCDDCRVRASEMHIREMDNATHCRLTADRQPDRRPWDVCRHAYAEGAAADAVSRGVLRSATSPSSATGNCRRLAPIVTASVSSVSRWSTSVRRPRSAHPSTRTISPLVIPGAIATCSCPPSTRARAPKRTPSSWYSLLPTNTNGVRMTREPASVCTTTRTRRYSRHTRAIASARAIHLPRPCACRFSRWYRSDGYSPRLELLMNTRPFTSPTSTRAV